MTFKKAREIFEQVQEEALQSGDSASEGIAAGLAELAKSMQSQLDEIKRMVKSAEEAARRRG